jgi:DNA-binding NtrC family response regulator
MAHDWRRNNVRELRNIIERMIIATDDDVLGEEQVPPGIGDHASPTAQREDGGRNFQTLRAEAERRIVIEALTRNDWHITKTAAELGLADHASLLKVMRRLGVKRPG